jgi:hypothetical protein
MFSGRDYRDSFEHKKRLIEGQYHLKIAGKPFVDKHCNFLFDFQIGNTMALFRSGLYDISKVTSPLPILTAGKVHDPASYNIDIQVGITKDVILAVYNESIYPTSDDILGNISKTHDIESTIPYDVFTKAVKDAVVDNVHAIMEKFRGNHYFFVCKTYDTNYDLPFNQVEQLRKLSKNTSEPLEELSPVELEGTRKGGFAFKHAIRRIFIKHKHHSQTLKNYGHESYMSILIIRVDSFIMGAKRQAEIVNDIITELNTGLERRLFKVQDIDPGLLSRIRKTQSIEGVIKFEG